MVNFLAVLLPDGTTAYRIGEILAVWGSLFVIVNFFMFWFWKARYKGLAHWFATKHGFRVPERSPLTVKEAERLVHLIKEHLQEVRFNVDALQVHAEPDWHKELVDVFFDYQVKNNEKGFVMLLDEYGIKCTFSARGDHDVIVDFDFDIHNPQPPKRWGQKRRFSLFSNLFTWWSFF